MIKDISKYINFLINSFVAIKIREIKKCDKIDKINRMRISQNVEFKVSNDTIVKITTFTLSVSINHMVTV